MPTRYDYYKRRAREHRLLATNALHDEGRAMHERLAKTYGELARKYCLRQVLRVKLPA